MSDLEAIRNRRAEIAAEKVRLDAEDRDLETAERVIVRLKASKTAAGSGSAAGGAQGSLLAIAMGGAGEITETRKVVAPTHEQMVLSVLTGSESPWFSSSSAVSDAVSAIYDVKIPKTSLRPMLSRLKREGTIVRSEEKGFALKARALLEIPVKQDASL